MTSHMEGLLQPLNMAIVMGTNIILTHLCHNNILLVVATPKGEVVMECQL